MFKVAPGSKEVVLTETFSIPPEKLWKIITDPAQVSDWWGPGMFTTTVDKMEVKPGGAWRYLQKMSDGNTYAYSGVYREVVPGKRLVMTFHYEAMPGHEMIDTLEFEKQNGGTKVTETLEFQSVEDRDGMLKSGMEEGSRESIERLTELLEQKEPV